jgi:hypothetical protein
VVRCCRSALPAGVGVEGGGAEGLEPGEQVAQPPVVIDPGLVVLALGGAEPPAHGFRGDLAARTVSAPVRTASVPAPAGGGTYTAICVGASGCPSGGVLAALRRSIHLPHIAAGTRCLVSAPGHKVDPNEAAAIGAGPVYVLSLMAFARTAVLPSRVRRAVITWLQARAAATCKITARGRATTAPPSWDPSRRHAERAKEWMICVIQRDSPASSFHARNRQGGIVSIRDHAQ